MKVDVVAKYIRLSDEDVDTGRGVKQESNSVVSQRRLLDGFIEGDAGLRRCRVLEFCDDGFSGTDFRRPGFEGMMEAVKRGGDRQELHEKIRKLSMEAGAHVKQEGKENNLLELIAADKEFNLTLEQLQATMDPSKYVGRAPVQVDKFLEKVIKPVLEANKAELGVKAEINV